MSVVVVATARPLPEFRAEVIAAFENAVGAVHNEPGCELYALNEGADRIVMIEKWADADALAVHSKAAALKELGTSLNGKLDANGVDVQILTPRPAGDPAKGAL